MARKIIFNPLSGAFDYIDESNGGGGGGDGDMTKAVYDPANGERQVAFSDEIPEEYTSADFDTDFAGKSTTDLSEGTNLYYTEARVSANTDVAANTAKRSYPEADEDKLAGIEAGAEVNTVAPADIANFETTTELNARDTANRNRDNHTGTQAISTISDLQDELDSKPNKRDADVTVTVGSGGDYATINAAIEALSEDYPIYKKSGFTAEISLLTGFEMKEQVFVKGVDLSWITITSVDASVTIDHTEITEEISAEDDTKPAFFARDNAKLPVLGCLFEYDESNTVADGVAVYFGSSVQFLPDTGIKNCRKGIRVLYGSTAFCYQPGLTFGGGGAGAGSAKGVDFSGCTARALHVAFNSSAGLSRSNFNNAGGDNAVYVIWNSRADIYQSEIKNATNTAVHSRDGSTINARETDASGAGENGYHALHNARINARYLASSPAGDGGADDCGGNGCFASNGGYIDAVGLPARNCGTGGFYALENSHINASNCDASGAGAFGVFARSASMINFTDGTANNVEGSSAIYALGSSSIDARGATATNADTRAVRAVSSSRIAVDNATLTGAGGTAVSAERGSHISAREADASGAGGNNFSVINGSVIAANAATGSTYNQGPNITTGNGTIHDATTVNGFKIGVISGSVTGTTGNKSITGVGFRPRLVRFKILTGTSTVNLIEGNGGMTATDQWYSSIFMDSNSRRRVSTTSNCIGWTNSSTSALLAEYVSMDDDGFTINVTQTSTSQDIAWEAYA